MAPRRRSKKKRKAGRSKFYGEDFWNPKMKPFWGEMKTFYKTRVVTGRAKKVPYKRPRSDPAPYKRRRRK